MNYVHTGFALNTSAVSRLGRSRRRLNTAAIGGKADTPRPASTCQK
jgi:hypothetical protein